MRLEPSGAIADLRTDDREASSSPLPFAPSSATSTIQRLRLRPWRQDALLFVVAWGSYLPMLARGFASEDFVILRRLLEGGLTASVAAQFTGPWLRLSGIGFYRPISTALLAGELALFGPVAWPYLLLHGGVHAVNAVLVARATRRLLRSPSAWSGSLAGLLFAIHPLGLNAVGFVASFATLYGVSLSLGALLAWWSWRVDEVRWAFALALTLFVLALGSYELAAALPGFVVLADLLAPGLPRARWRERVVFWWPWAAVLAVYLLWRRMLFGAVLGGYAETANLITRFDLQRRIPEAVKAISYLLVPAEATRLPIGVGVIVATMVGMGPWILAFVRRSPVRGEAGRVTILGALWALAGLVPFGVVRLVPANGRYAYLAVVGCAIALAYGADVLDSTLGRTAGALFRVLLVVGWGWLFVELARAQLAAGAAVALARKDLVASGASRAEAQSPLLCKGYPLFVTDREGTPLAQVFHYGLSDSARAPFGPLASEILPLTPGVVRDVGPLLRLLPDAQLLSWRENGGFERIAPGTDSASAMELSIAGPADAAAWPLSRENAVWAVSAASALRCDIVVAASGNAARFPVVPSGPGCRGELPRAFLDTEARLYGGTAYWWIEAVADDGSLRAASTARRIELGMRSARSWD